MEENRFKQKLNEKNRATYARKVKSKLPNFAKIVVVVLISLSVFIVVTRTSIFNLESSEIRNDQGDDLQYIDKSEIQSFVESEVFGKNFFLFDPSDLEVKLLKQFPFSSQIWIEKVFPNSVAIRIEEKEPYLLVDYEDTCYVIDDEGALIRLYRVDPDGEDENVGCVEYSQRYSSIDVKIEEGTYDNLFSSSGFFVFEQIFQVTNLLSDLGMEVDEVNIGDRIMTLTMSNGRIIIVDPFENFDDQLKRMVLVFNYSGYQGEIEKVDFRYERPVIRK